MRRLATILLCSTIAVPAWALSDPAPSPKDALDRTVEYDPHNRVPITIQAGGLALITFGPMETIDQVVKTDDAPFAYTEPKAGETELHTSNLTLVGKAAGESDLVVLTRGAPPNDDKERPYLFRIKVVETGSDDATLTKHLTFHSGSNAPAALPAVPPGTGHPTVPSQPAVWRDRKAKQDAEALQAKLRADVTFGPHNIRYLAQGRAREIAPIAAFDNGTLTAFRYPGNMQQPAVFRVLDNHQGTPEACIPSGRATSDELEAAEQQENTRVVGDLIVVDETAPHWRLRSGEAVLDVWNCAYDPIGHPPGTGTGVPDVVRRVITP